MRGGPDCADNADCGATAGAPPAAPPRCPAAACCCMLLLDAEGVAAGRAAALEEGAAGRAAALLLVPAPTALAQPPACFGADRGVGAMPPPRAATCSIFPHTGTDGSAGWSGICITCSISVLQCAACTVSARCVMYDLACSCGCSRADLRRMNDTSQISTFHSSNSESQEVRR
eukprot:1161684-Pelagomonas_calceolata.AAC.3